MNFSGIVRNVFCCVWDWLKFAVLVDLVSRLDSKLPCLSPFFFLLSWILCQLFSCFIPIRQKLTLVAKALASDVWFL